MARYTPYRGRRRGRRILAAVVGLLLVALIVVLVLAATQQIVFTPDGPQFGGGKPSPTAPVDPTASPEGSPSAEPSFIIETPSAEPSTEPSVAPTAEGRPDRIVAVQIDPRDTVAFGGAMQLAKDGLINTVVLELGEKNGALRWNSTVPLARTIGSVPADINDAFDLARIAELHDAGLYVAARISSLKESYLGNYSSEYAVKWADGRRWLDGDRPKALGWLDPYNETSRGYITDLVLELIDGGADEVLLDNFSFPTSGYTDSIAFEGEAAGVSRMEILNSFGSELAAAAKAKGGCVSLYVSPDRITDDAAVRLPLESAGTAAPLDAGFEFVTSAAADGCPTAVTVEAAYTDPSAATEIRAAVSANPDGVLLISADGKYPASW